MESMATHRVPCARLLWRVTVGRPGRCEVTETKRRDGEEVRMIRHGRPARGGRIARAGPVGLAIIFSLLLLPVGAFTVGPANSSEGGRSVPWPGERPMSHGAVVWVDDYLGFAPTGHASNAMTSAERADWGVLSLPLVVAAQVSPRDAVGAQAPAAAPSPRLAPGMAYDSGSDRTVLFGGFTEERVFLGDTWAFDLDHNVWSNMNPSGAPQPRGDPGFAYDPHSDRVVLFGGIMKLDGETSYADLNDTWAYDFDTNVWQNRSPVSAPSPRHGHKVAYDTESHRFVMIGGHT